MTNGDTAWLNSTNWLMGEPCVDQWHGVRCCPASYPFYDLSGASSGGSNANGDDNADSADSDGHGDSNGSDDSADNTDSGDSDDSDGITRSDDVGGVCRDAYGTPAPYWTPSSPDTVAPRGCRSVTRDTGGVADAAVCVVVALSLPANGVSGTIEHMSLAGLEGSLAVLQLQHNSLAGALPASLGEGSALQVVELQHNDLGGELPAAELTALVGNGELRVLDLSANGFEWRDDTYGGLIDGCQRRSARLRCAGLPPTSCELFAAADGYYKPSAEDPTLCTLCTDWSTTMAIAVVALVLVLLVVVAYGVILICVRGAVVFKWETTLVILCMHMQTVAIISALRLSWPPSVERTFQFFSLGAFQV